MMQQKDIACSSEQHNNFHHMVCTGVVQTSVEEGHVLIQVVDESDVLHIVINPI